VTNLKVEWRYEIRNTIYAPELVNEWLNKGLIIELIFSTGSED